MAKQQLVRYFILPALVLGYELFMNELNKLKKQT